MTLLVAAHRDKDTPSGHADRSWAQSVGLSYHRYCPAEAWTPAINLYEDGESYFLVMDLAGVKPKEIDIRVDDKGVLAIMGRRETPDVPSHGGAVKMHLMEIDHGRFCRSLDLPEDVDLDRVEASYRAGYLWVQVGKKA